MTGSVRRNLIGSLLRIAGALLMLGPIAVGLVLSVWGLQPPYEVPFAFLVSVSGLALFLLGEGL